MLLVNVGGGDHLAVLQAKERISVSIPHAAAPDGAERDALGGCRLAGSP
jgi:hypothetical protein